MIMVPAQTASKQPQRRQQQQQQHSNLYSTGGTCGGLIHNIINQDATLPLIFGPSTGIHHINNNKFGFVEESAAAGYDQYLYYNNSISISNHLSRAAIGGEGLVTMVDEEDSATISTNETGSTSNNTASKAQPPTPPCLHHNQLDAGQGGGWLRLGISGSGSTTDAHHNNNNNNRYLSDHPQQEVAGSMLELNLLPGGTTSTSSCLLLQHQQAATRAAAFLPPPPPPPIFTGRPSGGGFSPAVPILFYPSHHHHHHQLQHPDQLGLANYLSRAQGATTNPRVLAVASPSSTSSSLMQYATATQSFLQARPGPFQLASLGGASNVIRVVDSPPRPHSGLWFMLLPSLNQAKEPFLPQLDRNYLRIKDGKMTVRLLIKYLVNKLGLESESEVEIRCRGQELEGNLTMQQVRDEIWSGREAEMMALLPQSSTADHVMVIHYAR